MTTKQIESLIDAANDELKYRKKVATAAKHINKVLTGLSVDFKDIPSEALDAGKSRHPESAKGKSHDRKKSAPVKPKYTSEDNLKQWSGRGKPPGWVKDICETKNISLAEFKSSALYLISK